MHTVSLNQLESHLGMTELFKEAKNRNTHIMVERIVANIDDIVKKVRFEGWQVTTQGNASSRRNCAGVCSNTNCTQTRSFLIRRMDISSSIIQP